MHDIFQNLRYATRQLLKSPGFAIVAVLTLALGIGANTAIFTLLDQALLRTLPVSHPEQLVRLRYFGSNTGRIHAFGGDSHDYFSYPMYRDLRDKNQVFAGMLANVEVQVGVQWNNQSDLAPAEMVSGNYFDVLGIRPAMGRLLLPSDDVPEQQSGRGAQLQLLEGALRLRSAGHQPGALHQRPSVHHRRCCRAATSTAPSRATPQSCSCPS